MLNFILSKFIFQVFDFILVLKLNNVFIIIITSYEKRIYCFFLTVHIQLTFKQIFMK